MHVSCKGKASNIEDLKSHNSAYFRLWLHRVGVIATSKEELRFSGKIAKQSNANNFVNKSLQVHT